MFFVKNPNGFLSHTRVYLYNSKLSFYKPQPNASNKNKANKANKYPKQKTVHHDQTILTHLRNFFARSMAFPFLTSLNPLALDIINHPHIIAIVLLVVLPVIAGFAKPARAWLLAHPAFPGSWPLHFGFLGISQCGIVHISYISTGLFPVEMGVRRSRFAWERQFNTN